MKIFLSVVVARLILSFLFLILPVKIIDAMELENPDLDNLEQQAVALVMTFGNQLKPKLTEALAEGGAVYAIDVCAKEAPNIAAQLSQNSGWIIRRVSTKNRNPEAVPDAWEAAIIKSFEERLEKGVDPANLSQGEFTSQGYRFAKAQIAEPMCLMCHGETIAPEVGAALAEHYPGDNAVGYSEGQIRGIFSLIQPR